jgi:Domain of unknown function (DUF4430)
VRRRPATLLALAALAALGVGGCSVGAGESDSGGAALAVTRDFGARVMVQERTGEVPGAETVMRFLQRHADVDTGYGGRFVESIDGLRSGSRQGEQRDWFYYVNGIEAGKGAAEQDVHGGDRVWWDYRDWSAAMRVPAVVGSFPEPFLHGAEGKRYPVRIDCAPGANDKCGAVADALNHAGVETNIAGLGGASGEELLRVVVGEWEDVRRDNAIGKLEDGPAQSGVFARVHRGESGYEIDVLDPRGRVTATLRDGSGIVAATRFENDQPTWAVSGTDSAGVDRAIRLLEAATLRNRYAVAADAGGSHALPSQAVGEQ